MKSSTTFKLLILALLSASLVVVAAWYGLSTLTSLVNTVEHSANPDELSSHIDEMIYQLNLAENNMRAYNLSNDEKFRRKFLLSYNELNNDTVKLKTLVKLHDNATIKVKSISKLLSIKQEIHFSLMQIRYMDVLHDSTSSINELQQNPISENQVQIKKPFLKRVFSKNKLKSEILNDSLRKSEVAFRLLKENINSEKNQTNQRLNKLINEEFILIQRDDSVSEALHNLLVELRLTANEIKMNEARITTTVIRTANFRLQYLAISGTILLLLLVLAIYRDLVRAAKLRKELEIARKRAEELTALKALFLAKMSHEIRTPLSAISGLSELMMNNNDKVVTKNYATAIQYSSKHLLDLLNDLLDEASLQAGKLKLTFSDFNLEERLTEVKTILIPKAVEKKLSFVVLNNVDTKYLWNSDPLRIKQILINIAGNAIKYSDKGEVKIEVNMELTSSNKTNFVFHISDTGKGIAPSKLNKLFDRFENDSMQQRESTGLGLFITKELVDLFQGSIDVKSELNAGTLFTVKIPVFKTNLFIKQNKEEIVEQLQIFKGQNILLVEDNNWNSIVSTEMLKRLGAIVTLAENGLQTINALDQMKFDFAFFDLQLPDISGNELIVQLRNNKFNANQNISIYALTADLIGNSKDQLISLGFTDVFLKPLSMEMLNGYFGKEKSLENSSNKGVKYSLSAIERLTNSDQIAMNYFVLLFIKTARETLKEINQSINSRNYIAASAHAHKLIPAFQQFKVIEVVEMLTVVLNYKELTPNSNDADRLIEQMIKYSEELFVLLENEVLIQNSN